MARQLKLGAWVCGMDRPKYRIFVSSPSDVRPERLIAERVITKLARDLHHHCDVEAVFSARDPLPGLAEVALIPYLAIKRGF